MIKQEMYIRESNMTELERELKGLVDVLCDNLTDMPCGCDGCWLFNDDEGFCNKKELYEKYGLEE